MVHSVYSHILNSIPPPPPLHLKSSHAALIFVFFFFFPSSPQNQNAHDHHIFSGLSVLLPEM
ncbi:hypothetical protein EXN66_Car021019 [Channa argus]|uniref:Uncharacterized protein n=1 Tax=Channa argus TaxID=215402 RepID=A0A6G1QSY7_CHAAH|nr:hypothetical protein EXN66_Car021019 [Channa argus]